MLENEINWIQDETIRNTVKWIVDCLPDYFFTVPASSTGKYHPDYALGEGGLLRHTKAAVAIAKDLLGLEMYSHTYSPIEQDIIIAALILHDGLKHGIDHQKYVSALHPQLMTDWLLEQGFLNGWDETQRTTLINAINSHMGQWNTDYRTKKEILPKPKTKIEKFVHQADYLASRKYLEFVFDKINYGGERL